MLILKRLYQKIIRKDCIRSEYSPFFVSHNMGHRFRKCIRIKANIKLFGRNGSDVLGSFPDKNLYRGDEIRESNNIISHISKTGMPFFALLC